MGDGGLWSTSGVGAVLDWVPTGGWGANGRGSEGGGGEEGAVDSGGGGVDGVTGDFVEGVEDFARKKGVRTA